MRLIGNILWIVFFGGLATCIEYLIAGLILCVTIIGIPFGVQCFKFAELALLPFGREVTPADTRGPFSTLFNLLWLVFAGIWIALTHLFFAVVSGITIIGIPFALQHLKLAGLGLMPFNKTVR